MIWADTLSKSTDAGQGAEIQGQAFRTAARVVLRFLKKNQLVTFD